MEHLQDREIAYRIIDSGPDYITATVARDEGRWAAVQNNWLDLIHTARQDSGLVEDMGMMGYVGLLAGKVFWGTRWDGSLLRITGSDANRYWANWLQATGKPTRIDLQLTIRTGAMWRVILGDALDAANEANQKLSAARQRNISQQSDNRDGKTVYIGSRKSKSFGRIYHKYATDRDRYEHGDLRYEVELHGDEAALLLESFRSSDWAIGAYAVAYVVDWFERRGVKVPSNSPGFVDSRFTDVLEQNPLDKKLDWLYNQVGPTVRLLADQGHIAETFRVLYGPQWPDYVLGKLMSEGGVDDGEGN